MAATINTNIASINAQRNLNLSGGSLATSMQRISSGLRINSAKDDAAGLAISERMNTQVRGLTVASRNANDGISLAQTAEGALGKVGDMLQRMRDLAVQAGNATNSDSDRAALQSEVSQLSAEIDRVAKQTNFNGQKILDGSFAGAVFQVGANSGDNVTLGALADTRANQISNISYASDAVTIDTNDTPIPTISKFKEPIAAGNLSITVGSTKVPLEKIGEANSSLERLGQVVTAINNKSADTGVTAFMTKKEGTSEYTISLMSSKLDGNGQPVPVVFEGFDVETTGIRGGLSTTPSSYASVLATTAAGTPFVQADYEAALSKVLQNNPALASNTTFATALTTFRSGTIDGAAAGTLNAALTAANTEYQALIDAKAAFDAADPKTNALSATYTTAANKFLPAASAITAPVGAAAASWTAEEAKAGAATFASALQTIKVPAEMNIGAENQLLDQRGVDDIDISTQQGAWVALKKIDSAIDQVNSARATLGAMQSRFENAVNNIDIQTENLSAARGRIVDADFAKETANLSRTQILQQAGTAMVAQANQLPQQVLKLLQG
ncbi:MAG: flagellin [Comamonas sp.]